jgi:hypothetical protein
MRCMPWPGLICDEKDRYRLRGCDRFRMGLSKLVLSILQTEYEAQPVRKPGYKCGRQSRVTLRRSSIWGHCILEGWGLTIEGCTATLAIVCCCCWQDSMYHVCPQGFLAIALVHALITRNPSVRTALSTMILAGLCKQNWPITAPSLNRW